MELAGLKKLIAQKESLKVDFKRDVHQSSVQDMCKDIAAFANTEGGHILVGVEDNGNVIGVDWNVEKESLVAQQGMNCMPPIIVRFNEVPYPKLGTVVAVEIQKSTYIHRDANFRFPQRLGDRTVFMDTAQFISILRMKNLISSESQLNSPTPQVRGKPKKVEFLAKNLDSPKPLLRAEALIDLGNISWHLAVEEIPEFLKKVHSALKDEDATARIAALDLVSNLSYRMNEKRRKEYRHELAPTITDMVSHDKDANVRVRALLTLANIGANNVVDVVVSMGLNEPDETYPKFNLQNIMMRVVEAGLGYEMTQRLYSELATVKTPETEKRLKEILGWVRQTNWAR